MKKHKYSGKAINAGKAKHIIMIFLLALCMINNAAAQEIPTQQIRGVIIDQVVGTPLEGATVTLSRPGLTAVTDSKGAFRFTAVPVGIQQLTVSYIGYKDVLLENINLNSGKEVVLNIGMENLVQVAEAVIVKAGGRKNKPLNEMSAVSARAFSVEETQKYAAAVNDPLRMAAGFPGVFATDDGNNSIAIRGNSPTGLLWRMEGVDIPNPNHFSATGSSGGGISILSSQLLSNSDFVTSAFAAEYGNALSGVFDLKLRKGNNEQKEFTLQAGVLGLNVAAEGPLMPFYKGSYLVNYRYSTLSLLDKLGVPMEGGVTNFQDLSYNIYLPTKRIGSFTWFGFGGLSSQKENALEDSSKWEHMDDRYHSKFVSHTAATGITHQVVLGPKTGLRSAIGYSYSKIGGNYLYVEDDGNEREDYNDSYKTAKWTFTSTLNQKLAAGTSLRAGVILSAVQLDYFKKEREHEGAPLLELLNTKDKTQTVQAFAQLQYRPLNEVTFNAGMHYLQLMYNNSKALEPRASVKWQVDPKNSIALGYGGHSQVQALGVYFAKLEDAQGHLQYPNRKLGLTRAHHYVLSLQHAFHKHLSIKAELYYQQLYKVPVSIYDSSSFSVLNIQSEFITDPLVNKGRGRNYGVELSLEKHLSNSLYYTLSTSLYESRYRALDGVERDTRFNGNYLFNMMAGKEFLSSSKLRTFGVNIRTIYAGGMRTTPIDAARSVQEGHAIYHEDAAYTIQNPAYFRTDLRFSLKWNRKKLTSTLSLDFQNVSNRLNVAGQWYDTETEKVITTYQTGIIPVLNYKIEL